MRFILLLGLILFSYSCNTSKHISNAGDRPVSKYYGLSDGRLTPLALVKDSEGEIILKADKIKIVNEGGEPYTLGGEWVPSLNSYLKDQKKTLIPSTRDQGPN